MCRNCVKEEFPNRVRITFFNLTRVYGLTELRIQDRMCTDAGAYMANLKSCSECKSNKLEVTNKSVAEEGDEELVTFERTFIKFAVSSRD